MSIYEFRTTLTVSGGSASTISLPNNGGYMQQLLIIANTSGTVFRANIVDSNSITRRSYGFSTGELNDIGSFFPMQGRYTLNITNASANDTFSVVMVVQDGR